MANMSYVRFENTLSDLRDCKEHFFDDDLSESKQKARRRMVKVIRDIVEELKDNDEWEED